MKLGECDSIQNLHTDKKSVGLKLSWMILSQLSFSVQIVIIFQAIA